MFDDKVILCGSSSYEKIFTLIRNLIHFLSRLKRNFRLCAFFLQKDVGRNSQTGI